MASNSLIIKSVEQLDYRVTVGDVASSAGLEINTAQQGLLALASDAGAHLQVTDSGEIVYLFPNNFRTILRNKYWRLQLKEWWEKIWQVLFYIIRISFGILLIASILIMMVVIAIIVIAISSSRDSDNNDSRSSGGGFFFFPYFWSSDIFWLFSPGYERNYYEQQNNSIHRAENRENKMNFLEAVYSFIFGDGNPNYNLEERRWQEIGTVIRSNGGAVVAEQIAPYFDEIDRISQEEEEYILPVLARFNGYPKVSPEGELIYYFPDLQVTANQQQKQSLDPYLTEKLWHFSNASSGQIMGAIALGGANFILALVLGSLLQGDIAAQIGGLVAFVDSIYWLLLAYGIAFLVVPLVRYFFVQRKNGKIEKRNYLRKERAIFLDQAKDNIRKKIDYARQFAAQKVISYEDITYTTERDIIDQEIEKLKGDRANDITT